MTNKKILFTGGNGFIGRQIIPLIEGAGYDVVRPRSSQVRLEVDEEVATLFSDGQHYDAIIHAAIVGGRRDVDDDIIDFSEANPFGSVGSTTDTTI